jgi:prepilin signal peptidase PulO-like enzyme (type II secretory pathway)
MTLFFHPAGLLASPGGVVVALLAWAALAGTAYVDARRGRVPDAPLLVAALAIALAFLWLQPPELLLKRLLLALVCGGAVWAINEIWYYAHKQDALGMGDAKWSMLAVLAFGTMPVMWAWILGAWLALGWMAVLRLRRHKIQRVFFAPFLCVGLAVVKLVVG